jgi:hypothetical protein
MPKKTTPVKAGTSKKKCYAKITEHCLNAMHLRKTGERYDAYSQEIGLLAEYCSNLLKLHSEKIQLIITYIENTLTESHKNELEQLDGEIITLFNRRKKAHPGTTYGEKEIVDLTIQINNLERRKALPVAEIIEDIISDSLNQASKEYGNDLLQNFNPDEYEYRGEISFIKPTE